jgi:hypothetical protein
VCVVVLGSQLGKQVQEGSDVLRERDRRLDLFVNMKER